MTLDALIERLERSAGWEERAAVYQEIPAQCDPDGAVELLDSLRRRTRDGNDLFFLRAAAERLAREHRGLASVVEDLERRLYDHIPPPAESPFQWLDMPRGRVAAWCEAPPGRFLMGSSDGEGEADEHPRHEVEIEGFRIGTGPVTRAQYAAFDPGHRGKAWEGVLEEELVHHPVGGVTWYQANAFCDWLSQAFRGARLPGEEEWEYVCRAGTETPYWSGGDEAHLDRVGWYVANSGKRTHRIGEKPANVWGLFDVHGNVREWTASPYRNDYAQRAVHEVPPARVEAQADISPGQLTLVLRGGGFLDEAPFTRSAIRCVRYASARFLNVGFRVVLRR
jgi:formylglycine-generating enzyme required for sulfatase activity